MTGERRTGFWVRPHHVPLVTGGQARAWEEIDADLERSRQGGAFVLLGGEEPTSSPHLLTAIRRVRELGSKSTLITGGTALASTSRLDALVSAGLDELCLRLHAPSRQGHDAVAGKGSYRAALKALRLARKHTRMICTVLCVAQEHEEHEPAAWTSLADQIGASLRLCGSLASSPVVHLPTPQQAAWMDALWSAAQEMGVQVRATGLLQTSAPRLPVDPPAASASLTVTARDGWLPDATRGGIRAASPTPPMAPWFHLASIGAPPINLPVCVGGVDLEGGGQFSPACDPCPRRPDCHGASTAAVLPALGPRPTWKGIPTGSKVVILQPRHSDQLMVVSTLRALALTLEGRGVQVRLCSRWHAPFDADDFTAPIRYSPVERAAARAWRFFTGRHTRVDIYQAPEGRLGHPLIFDEPPQRAEEIDAEFWQQLDLSDADVVIVPRFSGAARVLTHPTTPAAAQIVLLDFHLLDGIDDLLDAYLPKGQLAAKGGWWPGDRVVVHSCFPRYAHLYLARGVPLRHVHWRPYPLHGAHFRTGPPPSASSYAFAGGRHHRDYATLTAAAAQLEGCHPLEVHADPTETLRPVPPLVLQGTTPVGTYFERMRGARFVVLPLLPDATRAAGISAIAMALAAGRPVVATRTGATQDHLRHGVDSLLVSPEDPAGLASAIHRLEHDPALLQRLHEGALQAREQILVSTWATEILRGAPPRGSVRQEDGTWRTW